MSTEATTTAANPAQRPGRLHPAARAAVVVLCLVAGLVLLDAGVRIFLQWRIAASVEEALPPGVEGHVEARVDGLSVLWQVVTGSLEHVELEADELRVLGVPLAANVDAYGVSLSDGPVPVPTVEALTGRLRIGQDALNALVPVPGAAGGVTLDEGRVGYDTTLSLLGLTVDVHVEATVAMRGDRLVIEATRLQIVGGPIDVDPTELLGGSNTVAIPLCTSTHLPIGVHLTGVDVSPGEVTVSVEATGFTLDESTLGSRGTCR